MGNCTGQGRTDPGQNYFGNGLFGASSTPSNEPAQYAVMLKSQTWQRDSHELFDYESEHVVHKSLRCTESSKITRDANDINALRLNSVASKQLQVASTKRNLCGLAQDNPEVAALHDPEADKDGLFFLNYVDLVEPSFDKSGQSNPNRAAL